MKTSPSLIEACLNRARDGNYNLGHLFMDVMRHKPADTICQIDAATRQSETVGDVLSRTIRLAKCFRKFGLRSGDVLALGGKNHIDLHIPYYAALCEGLPVVGVDPYFKYDEIKHLFKTCEPKIAFCQSDTFETYDRAARDLGLDVKIVTFDGEGNTYSNFVDMYSDPDDNEEYEVAEFDTDKTYGWLVSTSGTTGLPKVAAISHAGLLQQLLLIARAGTAPVELNLKGLNLSPVQWLTGFFNAIGFPLMNLIKVQTSRSDDVAHVIDVINEYKPSIVMLSPSTLMALLHHEKHCDLTCFRNITLTGSKIFQTQIEELKTRVSPECTVTEAYGQTETIGPVLRPNPAGPPGTCGVFVTNSSRFVKLVNPGTGLEITEPNVPGELWTKGPSFSEYYNNPEATAKAFSEDGWYKTGDLLYRDENGNYFFVDRIKSLIKYKNYQINPLELEEVIIQVSGVKEVCVVGIPHPRDGELPAACLVADHSVTDAQIMDIVASKLSPSKQLRGGVLFVEFIPKTSTGKVARAKVKDMVVKALAEKSC